MNDLAMLRNLRADPPQSPQALAYARARLLVRATPRRRHYRLPVRVGWQTAAAATVAVVLGVGVIVATYERAGGPGDGASTPPGAQPSGQASERPGPDPAVQAALARAADGARAAPAVPGSKGQFWYFKVVYRISLQGVDEDADELSAEYWYKVRAGLGELGRIRFEYETGDVIDVVRETGDYVVTEDGTRPLGFRDDPTDPGSRWIPWEIAEMAPTTVPEMRDFARNLDRAWSPGPEREVLSALLFQPDLTPQQRGAACEAFGQMPGLRLEPEAVDMTGRHGLGIVIDERATLILDSDTCAVLGMEADGATDATVESGVVDNTDERP
ncbi:MAG: hypothetical protein L0Y54_00210 [Sporichthyaceae bacterium]|nr:hypothetical protein [Sporichthyaceae bacterium]